MEKKENLDGRNLGSGPVGRWIIYIDKCTGCGEKVKMKEERYCSECEDCASACAFRAITFR